MTSQPSALTHESLPSTTHTGTVHLRVADLERALAFYQHALGYHAEQTGNGSVRLSPRQGEPAHFLLDEVPGVPPKPWKMAGLFHAAIRMPTRRDLARTIQRLVDRQWPVPGTADHGVSEAFYLNDPDGNGLEIYADRPRDQWPFRDGLVQMVTDPLDLESLFGTVSAAEPDDGSIATGSDIGHVHLQVSDLAKAERFYVDVLGFDVMQRSYRGALFVSAGGYHHHIGLNVWAGRGVSGPGAEMAGLIDFSILLPDQPALHAVTARLESAAIPYDSLTDERGLPGLRTHDFDGIGVVVQVEPSE